MDSYEDSESQATQLLLNVLAAHSAPAWKTSKMHSANNKEKANSHSEISAGSLASSRHSVPHYNLHGLAETQTQSRDDDEMLPESQKENLQDPNKILHMSPFYPQSLTPQSSPPRRATSRSNGQHVSSPSKSKASNKAAPINSPGTNVNITCAKSTSALPITPSRRSRPPSPHEDDPDFPQDSFAHTDPQTFLRTKFKQLDLPLHELQKGIPGADTRNRPSAVTPTKTMFSHQETPWYRPRRSSSPHGNILVEATPEHSMNSELQSQAQFPPPHQSTPPSREPSPDPFSPVPRQPDFPLQDEHTQDIDGESDSSDPSFSYFEHGKNEPVVEELQPTQPTTEPDVDATQNDGAGQSTMAYLNTLSSGRRGLLSLISPGKRYRYQHLIPEETTTHLHTETQPITPDLIQQRMPTPPRNDTIIGDATQPSNYNEGSTSVIPPRRALPSKPPQSKSLTPTRKTSGPPVARNAHEVTEDTEEPHDMMDVVPDSEPHRDDTHAGPAATRQNKLSSKALSPRVADEHGDESDGGYLAGADLPKMDEEQQSDDDDIPLANMRRNGQKVVQRPAGKSKRTTSKPNQAHREDTTPKIGAVSKGKQREISVDQRAPLMPPAAAGAHPWLNSVVPSSIPEQDSHQNGIKTLRSAQIKQDPSATKTARSGSRGVESKGVAKKLTASKRKRARRQIQSDEEEEQQDEDESDLTSDDELMMPGPVDNEETADDEGEDEEMETESPEQGSRKRKRRHTTPKPRVPSKSSIRSMATTVRNTPTGRQSKKSRSMASMLTRVGSASVATRVFALWKQDGHYYPGVVHSVQSPSMYKIKFDDGTEGVASIDQLRLGNLCVGDDVLVTKTTRSSKIIDINGEGEDQMVTVAIDGDHLDVALTSIRVASRTITFAWKDRILTSDDIIPVVKPVKVKQSPTPSRQLVSGSLSARGNRKKVLASVGLVVTLGAGNENWEKDKERVSAGIKSNGGMIIDEWSSIIKMEGKYSNNSHRWVIEKHEVEWIGKEPIDRVFLLADEPSQKPKFLIAIALGIPCLSTTWLEDTTSNIEEAPWAKYLLDQGWSGPLETCITQQVDSLWGNTPHHVKHIMDNPVPAKVFNNKEILCIGHDMVPQPKRKGASDRTQEATNAVVRIILCMGAQRVEAVTDLKYVPRKLSSYDYIVIRERENYTHKLGSLGPIVVDWQWVKDCLISSRLLPFPDWPE